MYNGRFEILEAVLNHYSTGVQDSPSLDSLLKQDGTLGIPLTQDEKKNIIMFLQTLTDEDFASNPQFSDLN